MRVHWHGEPLPLDDTVHKGHLARIPPTSAVSSLVTEHVYPPSQTHLR